MALITCSECNSSISDKAAACPQCGCPVEHTQKSLACAECGGAVTDPLKSCPHCGCPAEHMLGADGPQAGVTTAAFQKPDADQRAIWLNSLSERWQGLVIAPTFLVSCILFLFLADSMGFVGWWLVIPFGLAVVAGGMAMALWQEWRKRHYARRFAGRDDLLEEEATKRGLHGLVDGTMRVVLFLGFLAMVGIAFNLARSHRIAIEPNDAVIIPIKSNENILQSIEIEFKPRSGLIPTIFVVEDESEANALWAAMRAWRNNPDDLESGQDYMELSSRIRFVSGDLGSGWPAPLNPIALAEQRLLRSPEAMAEEMKRLVEDSSDDPADMAAVTERWRDAAAARGATFSSGRIDLERPFDRFYLVVFNISTSPYGEILRPEDTLRGTLTVRQRQRR